MTHKGFLTQSAIACLAVVMIFALTGSGAFLQWTATAQQLETMPTIHEAAADDSLPDRHAITIPTIDISGATSPDDLNRHVILASGRDKANWQHPHMLLMPDGTTIFAVWTHGHGGTCGLCRSPLINLTTVERDNLAADLEKIGFFEWCSS